jgi:hypothetical protein
MPESKDLFTLNIRTYGEIMWGIRCLAYPIKDRWAIDLGRFSFILEFWFIREICSLCYKRKI